MISLPKHELVYIPREEVVDLGPLGFLPCILNYSLVIRGSSIPLIRKLHLSCQDLALAFVKQGQVPPLKGVSFPLFTLGLGEWERGIGGYDLINPTLHIGSEFPLGDILCHGEDYTFQ